MGLLHNLVENFGEQTVAESLSAWELGFLTDISKKQDMYKKNFSPTEKQEKVISRIVSKVSGEYQGEKEENKSIKGLESLVAMMHLAALNQRYPKLKFQFPDMKLVFSVCGDKAKYPGAINITDGGPYGSNKWYGRIMVDGTWFPSAACSEKIIEFVTTLGKDPEEVAKSYGKESGSCCFCGSEITTEESLAAGYGPICAKTYGLEWGNSST